MLTTKIKKDIARHAFSEFPKEACGVIIAIEDKPHYKPCVNLNESDENFRMCPESYAAAEDQGQVISIVHSHTTTGPQPSEADLVSCEATELPWHIIAVGKNAGDDDLSILGWHSFEPSNYESPLVGRSFHHGILDCYTLVQDFYARELGITLPYFERPDFWWDKPEYGELYLDNFESAGFVEAHDDIRYGDVLLITNRSERVNHAGVYLGDTPLKSQPDLFPVANAMLHHSMPRLSERVVYGDFWRTNTRKVVRHKELLNV